MANAGPGDHGKKNGKKKRPRRPFSWMNPKLEVRDTGKYGKGVLQV